MELAGDGTSTNLEKLHSPTVVEQQGMECYMTIMEMKAVQKVI